MSTEVHKPIFTGEVQERIDAADTAARRVAEAATQSNELVKGAIVAMVQDLWPAARKISLTADQDDGQRWFFVDHVWDADGEDLLDRNSERQEAWLEAIDGVASDLWIEIDGLDDCWMIELEVKS